MKNDLHGSETSIGPRPALVVAGMHRSGTSAMARVLSLAGAALPERVINPGPDNPLGFWEPVEMVALNDEILASIDSAWDDVFVHFAVDRTSTRRDSFVRRASSFIAQNYGDKALPVLKDPRASVLAPIWRQALEQQDMSPVYVVMVRHPLEVAESLRTRDGFPIQQGLFLWAAYMLALERDTRGQRRIFVSYLDLLDDWQAVLDRIEHALGLPLPRRSKAAAQIEAFLSRSHRHHEADTGDLTTAGSAVVGLVYAWMQAATANPDPDPEEMATAERAMQVEARMWEPVLRHTQTRARIRLIRAETAIADSEARLLRERARVAEVIAAEATRVDSITKAEAARRDELTLAASAASGRADGLEQELQAANSQAAADQAALRSLRLELTALKTTVSQLLDERMSSAARVMALEAALGASETARADADAARAHDAAEQERLFLEAAEEIETLRQREAKLRSSISWKVTRPVRTIQKRLKR